MLQLITESQRPYPHSWHQRLSAYGKDAGFTNSIYEKFIFLPLGTTNHYMEGEILVLNAQPFPDSKGCPGRIVISRVGKGLNDYRRAWYPETRIQDMFHQLNIQSFEITSDAKPTATTT